MKIIICIPLKTVSEANIREHWAVKAKRTKLQRGVTFVLCQNAGLRPGPSPPTAFTITRVSAMPLDTDNLAGALKHVQDGVADAVGINDRDLKWTYAQKKCRRKEFGVEVEYEKVP